MAHDETGTFDASALTPATRALAAGTPADPPPAHRINSFALQVALQSDPPGWWAGNVWEQYANYQGAVAIAIEAYMTALKGARCNVLRRKTNKVKKSLGGGQGNFSRDDDYEPVEADHPLSQVVLEPGGPSGVWGLPEEAAFLAIQNQLTGDGFIWTPFNRDGKPVRMFGLTTGSVTQSLPAGSPQYPQGAWRVTPYMGGSSWFAGAGSTYAQTALLPGEEVHRFRRINPASRNLPLSRLDTGARDIDMLKAITEFRWSYFNSGIALDTVVMLPGADPETAERVQKQLTQKHGGAKNARKLGVFGGPVGEGAGKASIQQLAPNAKDLDFPNGFEQALGQVLAIFGVPKLVANFGDSSNYATFHGELRRFYDNTISPFCRDLSAFLTRALARPWSEYAGEYVIEIEPQIPKDVDAERAELQSALSAGAITVNEYRMATGRDAWDDGDEPLPIVMAKKQAAAQPAPMPGADPNAPPGAEAAPMPGADGGAMPPDDGAGAMAPEGDDSPEGVQDATLQAALSALGMGDQAAPMPDDGPMMKAATPVQKPGGTRKVRAEGERWTGADGKQWTKKNGKIVPAPQQSGSGSGQGAAPKTGTNATPATGGRKDLEALATIGGLGGGMGMGRTVGESLGKTGDVPQADRAGKTMLAQAFDLAAKKFGNNPDTHKRFVAAVNGLKENTSQGWHAALNEAFKGAQQGGTNAAPSSAPAQPATDPKQAQKYHKDILKAAGKNAKAFGLTPEVLAKMHPDAVKTIAAQLGIVPPEQHYAQHAAAVPVTPAAKSHLERAHEWADSMAQKHAQRVAQHLGIRPEAAHKILAKAIRQVAEHAIKNGGRASGTLSVGGQSLKVGVGKTGDAARNSQRANSAPASPARSKPPQPTAAPPRPEAKDRPGTAAGSPTPEAAPRRGLLSRLKDSRLGRLGGRALEAYKDAVDRGIIVAGTDEERADARERRAGRVRKAFDVWQVIEELHDAGENEIADELHDLLTTEDETTIRKAMNTLSDPDGGFLVPPATPRRRKRAKVPVAALVRKALYGG